ncbi:diaminopimelate epimerase [Rubidibacter lacunae KORDI 51-2]|uniref:Diaminopimelate epimerase n=1 Tax=Rubidibacter lacunae KORDI 51-2 TaxID=582515 RepID=U5DF84_9CHRO|nr:diaminopimelate epimerase [Rubidibacter lacunae]ERN39962.1 diaminopimelate epimerase [Rubidibacter lacunae KORDI 51-2]
MATGFAKYHGLGNDFILLDNRDALAPHLSPEEAVRWCDRHFGIGADGVIFALPGQAGSDYSMRIFNSDGSEPEMCGNGIRCLARFLAALEGLDETASVGKTYRIHTLAGSITPQLAGNGRVAVDMGPPYLLPRQIPTTLAEPETRAIDCPLRVGDREYAVTCVSMGNPHCIIFVPDASAIALEDVGPQIEHHPAFPQRTNVEFVEIVRPDYLKVRVWERGAGPTLACGTGACATVVAGVLNGKCERTCTVELPGGPLAIRWAEDGDGHAFMTGPAERVFAGKYEG